MATAAITGAAVPLREIMIDVLVLVNASPAPGHFARVTHRCRRTRGVMPYFRLCHHEMWKVGP